MRTREITINCDGICKKRKEIKDLMFLGLGKQVLFICKDCLNTARQLTTNDLEWYKNERGRPIL